MTASENIRFSIKLKIFIAITSIILFISLTTTFSFLSMTKIEFLKEIEKRGISEANDIANEAKYGVFIENKSILNKIIANRMKRSDIAYIEIFREDGLLLAKIKKNNKVLLRNKEEELKKDLNEDISMSSLKLKSGEKIYEFTANIVEERDLVKSGFDGVFFFGGKFGEIKESQPITSTIGNVKVGISLKNMKNMLSDIIFTSVLILFIVIIIAIASSIIFIRWIVKPISHVTQVAMEISEGDLTKTVAVKSSDEIGLMAKNFNKMTNFLKNTINELETFKQGLEKQVEKRTSDLKKANIEMIKAYNKLSELEQIKTNFVSTVSHELRTPLTSIVGFANNTQEFYKKDILPQLAADNKRLTMKSKRIEKNLIIMVSEGERLARLVNDLLDISKMEAGKIQWNITSVDINKVCHHSLSIVDGYPKRNGVKICFDSSENVLPVKADSDRLVQVITNFMSNALKFTEKGSVTLKVEAKNEYVKVSVIDTGIGIDKEDIKKVFDKFQQVGENLTDKPKGTGLGLPICKEIINHFGGDINVVSEIGKGSSFSFNLNYFKREKKEGLEIAVYIKQRLINEMCQMTNAKHINRKRNILIVDDDDNFRELIRQILRAEGYNVFEAKNGLVVSDMIDDMKNYLDLILLDIMMPVCDGFDVLKLIRTNKIMHHVPVIVISAYEVNTNAFNLGADSFLSKPLSKDKLIDAVSLLLKKGKRLERVLIIDSDKNFAQDLKSCLERTAHIVSYANNSKYGIDIAQKERPDVTMVAIELPDIKNGKETFRKLCAEKEQRCMRVVLLVDEKNNNSIKVAESLKREVTKEEKCFA